MNQRLENLMKADSAQAIDNYRDGLRRANSIRFQKVQPGVQDPKRGTADSVGLDIYAHRIIHQEHYGHWGKVTYGTGLAFEIPSGYFGALFPRSSVRDLDLILSNCVGVIDPDYRGEVEATFYFFARPRRPVRMYEPGDRFCQLVMIPCSVAPFMEVDNLSDTARKGGYGWTGVR